MPNADLLPLPPDSDEGGVSRRHFLKQMGMTGLIYAAPSVITSLGASRSPAPAPPMETIAPGRVAASLKVNGTVHPLEVEPRAILLDVLRDGLGLTGAKRGCDHGQCGACTILINGRRVLSCLTLAAMHDGDEITTIEGLERAGELHPMQQAFLDCDAYQCGYCTSGQIVSAVGLLQEPVGADDAAVREAMSGNLCRCGAYRNILKAVQSTRSSGS